MAKVQFNCRLEESVVEWITEEAEKQSAKLGKFVSQADVITMLIGSAVFVASASSQKKLSKKDRLIAELEASDPVGAARDDVELGNFELPRGGSIGAKIRTDVQIMNRDLNRPPEVSVADWRSGRKPLLRPKERTNVKR